MNHKEMTGHIRGRLKSNGIKACCSKFVACGVSYISIAMDRARFDGCREWTAEEAETIASIAKINGLTSARKQEIDISIQRQLTRATQFDFEFHAS